MRSDELTQLETSRIIRELHDAKIEPVYGIGDYPVGYRRDISNKNSVAETLIMEKLPKIHRNDYFKEINSSKKNK
jgi:hypothetical protein